MLRFVQRVALAGLWLGAVPLAACGGTDPEPSSNPAPDQVLVAASIAPLADFARQVGGDHVRVMMLVPAGASPHTYEMTPSQVAEVSGAQVLVLNGINLEYWVDDLIDSIDNPALRVVDTSQGIEILEGSAGEPGGNPHIWLDPLSAVVQVEQIRDALMQVDPAHADSYRSNAHTYATALRALDQEIAGEVATWSNQQFIAFHPSWVYFARRYGLEQAAVIQRTPGRELSPAELIEIVETARRIGAKAIFAEPQFSPKAAETIAEESGAQVIYLDPLGTGVENSEYLSLMRSNVAQMAHALR